MQISIYDLDKTLTRRATFTPFLAFAAWRVAPLRIMLFPVWVAMMLAHKAGTMDRTTLKRRGMKLMLGGASVPRLEQIGREFAQRRVTEDGLMPGALRLLEEDRARGATIAIATAAFGFYAQAFADALGIDHLIATQWDGAAIPGGNCYGATKRDRVVQWMNDHGVAPAAVRLRFVSDSFADAPLLDMADEAIFVTGTGAAASKAEARGWRAMDLSL